MIDGNRAYGPVPVLTALLSISFYFENLEFISDISSDDPSIEVCGNVCSLKT